MTKPDWRLRGVRYAMRLLERGSSPRELAQSLSIASRDLETATLDEALALFAEPAAASRRDDQRRAFLAGAMSIAVASGGLAIGRDDESARSVVRDAATQRAGDRVVA